MPEYCHLHNHTQFSLLDGATSISKMMKKASKDGMKAVALTDHGNMFGAFKFVREAQANGVKAIVGSEFYLVEDRHKHSFIRSKGEKDRRFHQLLLAKNATGYKNLTKLSSLGFIEGLYGKYPRIDKELLEKYSEGVICTSCCIGAEIPQAILHGEYDKAEELIKYYKGIFGDDFYIELQRHRGLENIDGTGVSQEDINQKLIKYAEKYDLKTIATNDSHYLEEDDSDAHDILLAINTGAKLTDDRFKFPSADFYFKTQAEMNVLFADQPDALYNTMEIESKVEHINLANDMILPSFPLPKEFNNQDAYLKHIAYEGARMRYGTITPELDARLQLELGVIEKSGYPGYFLIVEDFIAAARELDVVVGPGRGSAAGSVVAYCLRITDVDPLKYDLLFERFLNPERISMPDIDIDFDNEGRERVIDYVINKYGQNNVAQIITYGTMAAKMSIKDVGRVMDLDLDIVNSITKSFPQNLSSTLNKVLADGDIDPGLKSKMNAEDVQLAYNFRKLANKGDKVSDVINTAKSLEGSVRNTGIHACGLIITPEEVSNYVPVSVAKDGKMLVSQFDNSVVEDAGLLKMDFLGLKTLSTIKDAKALINRNREEPLHIDIEALDDKKTYELFQEGDTVGVFQYESPGMQKYLRELQPTNIEDLIAMNALYRPGPLAYIPSFINRKNGKEPIEYDLPEMEEYLSTTYGITVYQEQVMLLSQKLAGFTKGQADSLRKAMGKKKKKLIDEMWPIFLEGCTKNNHPEEVVQKIWKDWEAFASYAFNKSHSTCYAIVAYETAYLKANHREEYMAAVLNTNKNDIVKITFFLRECKRMGIEVLGPDINESHLGFSINAKRQIRFGMSALKGVGEGPVNAILEERENGNFESIFDFVKRVNLKSVNKRVFQSLVLAGAFDNLDTINRAEYFSPSDKYDTFGEHILKFGAAYQKQNAESSNSLFGDMVDSTISVPTPPKRDEWPKIEKLTKEKDVTGIFISGHPLDDYRVEVDNFVNCSLDRVRKTIGAKVKLAGLVTEVFHGTTKKGTGTLRFTIQDYTESLTINLYNEEYNKFAGIVEIGSILYVEGYNRKGWSSDNYFFKVDNISFLETIGNKLTQNIKLLIPLELIIDGFMDELYDLCKLYPGRQNLYITIVDRKNNTYLDMKTTDMKLGIDNRFIELLEAKRIQYKINV